MTAVDRELFFRRVAEILQVSSQQFEAGGRRLPEDPDSVVLLDLMALVDELTGVALSPDALKSAKTADAILELTESSVAQ